MKKDTEEDVNEKEKIMDEELQEELKWSLHYKYIKKRRKENN